MQIITSKENNLVKHICKLQEKKYRNQYNEFVVEGVKLVKEALVEKAKIKKIIISESAKTSNLIEKYLRKELENIDYIQVQDSIFKLLSDCKSPQGILAVIEKEEVNENLIKQEDIIIALDGLQDPGNLGTILRTIDSVGLTQVLVSKNTADCYNSKVIRSTMGAIFRVKIIECEDFRNTLNNFKKRKYDILVTSLGAKKSIYDVKLDKKIIVIGNEANGVTNQVLEIADEKTIIPMLGKTESLNASVATGVILYEYVRQKISK